MRISKFLPILFLVFIKNGYGLNYDLQDYINSCKNIPYNKDSACTAYFNGVTDTLLAMNNHPCFTGSDKEIYRIGMAKAAEYIKKYPGPWNTAAILTISLKEAFPCRN